MNRPQPSEVEQMYVKTFTSDAGKRVLEDLKRRVGLNDSPFSPQMTHQELAHRIGQQDIVREIIYTLSKFGTQEN